MKNASQTLEQYFPEMRWRCLSLAADLDRIQRANSNQMPSDRRLAELKEAIQVLVSNNPNRAEQVQLIFSDKTPPAVRERRP